MPIFIGRNYSNWSDNGSQNVLSFKSFFFIGTLQLNTYTNSVWGIRFVFNRWKRCFVWYAAQLWVRVGVEQSPSHCVRYGNEHIDTCDQIFNDIRDLKQNDNNSDTAKHKCCMQSETKAIWRFQCEFKYPFCCFGREWNFRSVTIKCHKVSISHHITA